MKYAVIATGGKQYKVTVGQTLRVEKLGSDAKEITFDQVLLVVDGDQVEIGTPTVAGVQVFAEYLGDVKAEKIEVFKFKSKSRYRRHTGHRQGLAQVKITGIGTKETPASAKSRSAPGRKAVAPKKVVTKKAPVKKAPVKKAAAKK